MSIIIQKNKPNLDSCVNINRKKNDLDTKRRFFTFRNHITEI
jgi:hypothetical protein